MLYWTSPCCRPFSLKPWTSQFKCLPYSFNTELSSPRLREGDLVGKYPEAAAKLLIHLGKTEQNPWTWYRAKEIFDKLLLSDLESETEVSLKATAAKVVLW